MSLRMLQNCFKSSGIAINWSRCDKFVISCSHLKYSVQTDVDRRRPNSTGDNAETSKVPESNFDQLRKEIQYNGFVNHKSFERIIASPNEINDENSLLLINSCAHFLPTIQTEEKIGVFRKVWDQIKKTTEIRKDHYLSTIKVFRANKFSLGECRDLFKGTEFERDWEVYEGLISLACELGNVQEATDILAEMKTLEFPITENVFNSLILGYSRTNDLKSCETVLDNMNAANIVPSNKTYGELLKAYVENSVPDKAIRLLERRGNSLATHQLVEIIKSAALRKYVDVITQAINLLPDEMTSAAEVPNEIRTLCTELVHCGLSDEAFLIVTCFPTHPCRDGQDIDKFGVSLINDYIRTSQSSVKTIEMCQNLIALDKNVRALHVASEIALRRNPDCGLEFLQALSEIETLRSHYFWPLIIVNSRKRGEIGILDTLKRMSTLKVECDFETMSSYVFPRLAITCKDVKKAVVALEDCGLKTSEIIPPFISHLLLQHKFDDIIWLTQTYQSKIDTEFLVNPLVHVALSLRMVNGSEKFAKMLALLQMKSHNTKNDLSGEVLLHTIGSSKRKVDPEIIANIINELKLAGIKISAEAADGLSSYLGKSEKDRSSFGGMVNRELNLPQSEKDAIHPRDMSLEDLECHLIELQNKGMNTRGVLRRILQLTVREGKLERALEIHKKCIELKVQRSPGMVASVLDMYIKLENIRKAEEAYGEIKKKFPGFLLDEHKIIDFCTLLVRRGRLEDAKKIISQRAASSKVLGGDHISKNIWQLLTAVAQHSSMANPSDSKNYSREMLDYLHNLGFCSYNNTNLGTVIREYLLKNQIVEAVTEFKVIAETYRKTPLQLELMSELVRLSSSGGSEFQTMLQQVITETSKIHGSLNTNSNLILALAESGTENQLRKLLIDPQFKFNQENLIRNCEHLSSSGKIQVLMKLAKSSRGLGHNVKEQDLYNILLNSFARENNWAAAIELFEKLEMDDEFKISQVFIRNLVDLLERNNLEIPSNVALRAQLFV